jgi:hypothetical protein
MSDTTIELQDDERPDRHFLLHSNEHSNRYDITSLKGKGGAGRVWRYLAYNQAALSN